MIGMDVRRHLCSQLVSVNCCGATSVVNLEEIWRTGAMLECENALPLNEYIEIRWDSVMLTGRVRYAEPHEFGYRVEVVLSPLTPWSLQVGEPAHLIEINSEI